MLWRSFVVLASAVTSMAFVVPPTSPVRQSVAPWRMSTSTTDEDAAVDATAPLFVVEGKNIVLTDALMAHVQKRIGGPLKKLSAASGAKKGIVTECDVVLSVSKNPKIKESDQVEIVANLKGTTFVCTHASPDMYHSIDQAAHALQRKLVKYKERRQDGWHGGSAMGEDLLAALEAMEADQVLQAAENDADDDFVDPEAPTITKIKSFDLENPISVKEAIFALDYVDHDFYVFNNEETNKLTVVYKRNGGGIGLIEP